eukprot:scaffold126758_cov98-Cyclotella_meneghiniana.AAC.3
MQQPPNEHRSATVSALAPPRQHIRTVGFGAENHSMCITLQVSTARCVTETDLPNVLPQRWECDGYCPLGWTWGG